MALRGREFAHAVTKCIEILPANVTGTGSVQAMERTDYSREFLDQQGSQILDALPYFRMRNQSVADNFNRYRIIPLHPFR